MVEYDETGESDMLPDEELNDRLLIWQYVKIFFITQEERKNENPFDFWSLYRCYRHDIPFSFMF